MLMFDSKYAVHYMTKKARAGILQGFGLVDILDLICPPDRGGVTAFLNFIAW
jgi:hypothetical protein